MPGKSGDKTPSKQSPKDDGKTKVSTNINFRHQKQRLRNRR